MRASDWLRRSKGGQARSAPTADVEEALTALRVAIVKPDGDGSDIEYLHMLILEYCMHARTEGLAPERMLVRFKQALDGPLAMVADTPVTRETMRTHLVNMAIDAYYDGH